MGTARNSKNFLRVDGAAWAMTDGGAKKSAETTASSHSDILPLEPTKKASLFTSHKELILDFFFAERAF
jgi:hypothetical protein